MIHKKYPYHLYSLDIAGIDPAVLNILKHWAISAELSLPTLCRYILTDAAQKKMDGKIKLKYPDNAEW